MPNTDLLTLLKYAFFAKATYVDFDSSFYGIATHGTVTRFLQVNGRPVRLRPGMQVTAEMLTGERRIIDYLLTPVIKGFKESVRERLKKVMLRKIPQKAFSFRWRPGHGEISLNSLFLKWRPALREAPLNSLFLKWRPALREAPLNSLSLWERAGVRALLFRGRVFRAETHPHH